MAKISAGTPAETEPGCTCGAQQFSGCFCGISPRAFLSTDPSKVM